MNEPEPEKEPTPEEQEAIKKALGRKSQTHPINYGYLKMPYQDEENLIHTVKSRYPAATKLYIIDPSVRDSDGGPHLRVKELRGITATFRTYKKRTYLTPDDSVTASWSVVLCFVEKPWMYLKVANYKIGET